MKKTLTNFTERDFSKLPLITGLVVAVLAVLSLFAMIGMTLAVQQLGLAEIVPVWVLQLTVMSPWVFLIGFIFLAIVACILLMVVDISIHKNIDEYKNAFQFWNKKEDNSDLSEELFGVEDSY